MPTATSGTTYEQIQYKAITEPVRVEAAPVVALDWLSPPTYCPPDALRTPGGLIPPCVQAPDTVV